MSIAWKHKRKFEALEKNKTVQAENEQAHEEKIATMAKDQNAYDLLKTSLGIDLKRVSMLPRGTQRTELKRNELLPKYLPYVKGYIEKGESYKNEILVQVMIWLFDIGEMQEAIDLAELCIEQKQPMPERFKRHIHNFTADAVMDWCIEQQAKGKKIEPHFSAMYEKVMAWPVHDQIKMRYMKVKGAQFEKEENFKAALDMYEKAEQLCPKEAKVKTNIAKLKKIITPTRGMNQADAKLQAV